MNRVFAIQNCEIESFGLYARVLAELGVDLAVVQAWRDDPLPPLETVRALLVHGTPISVYASDSPAFLRGELDYLRRALGRGVPCLGICGGAEALAMLLGADVRRNPSLEIGVRELRLTEAGRADPLLRDFPDRFPAVEWHGDAFDVPPGGELLVEGHDCHDQMFRRGNVVGLMFHLEYGAADVAAWADAYAAELTAAGATKDEVVAACRAHEPTMDSLARSLMARFTESITGGASRDGPPRHRQEEP